MKKLGMVIINYNDATSTISLLNSIKDTKVLDLIVIVDNKSTDDSVKVLRPLTNNKIKLIANKENKGYAYGLNVGAKYLIKELPDCNIIFSNTDIIIDNPNDLSILNNDLKGNIAVVGPTIIEHNNLNRGWMLPTIKTEIKANIPLLSRNYNKKLLYRNAYYHKDLSKVDVVSGCFFLVSSVALEKVGYFDEHTFLYYEENILAYKLKEAGYIEVIDNNVDIIHNHATTIDNAYSRINKFNILKTSQLYFVTKYLNASKHELRRLAFYKNLALFNLKVRGLFKGGK
jgi:GT2 family glycosyltransferase